MLRAPTARLFVTNVHDPDTSVQVPMAVAPSKNVMDPVAAPLLTVPVNVTDAP